jgi:hypothetical protein
MFNLSAIDNEPVLRPDFQIIDVAKNLHIMQLVAAIRLNAAIVRMIM